MKNKSVRSVAGDTPARGGVNVVEGAEFVENNTIKAGIDGKTYFIPDDLSNRHRLLIDSWVSEENQISPLKVGSHLIKE